MIYMIYTRNHVANYGDGSRYEEHGDSYPKKPLTSYGKWVLPAEMGVGLEWSGHWQLHPTRVATFRGAFFWVPGGFFVTTCHAKSG